MTAGSETAYFSEDVPHDGKDRNEMNLLHLKYAVEIEKTGSITKAANNLFMGQPNLSKAIKELEAEIGITIFRRTTKGVVPTEKGGEFLGYAKAVLDQFDEMVSLYKPKAENEIRFSISAPRASYITKAFTNFVSLLDNDKDISINFKETNSMDAVNNIINFDFKLGIIRYQNIHEKQYFAMLDGKNLKYRPLWEFEYRLITKADGPIAKKARDGVISYGDLEEFIEIVHGDISVPSLSFAKASKAGAPEHKKKRIYVYERGSQFDLLGALDNTYMWVSPMPRSALDRIGLVQLKTNVPYKINKDVLIYPRNYRLSRLDELFIAELERVKEKIKMDGLY